MPVDGSNQVSYARPAIEAGGDSGTSGGGGLSALKGALNGLVDALGALRDVLISLRDVVNGNDAAGGGVAVQDGAGAQAATVMDAQPAVQGANTVGSQATFAMPAVAPAPQPQAVTPPPQIISPGGGPVTSPDPVINQVRPLLSESVLGTAVLDQLEANGGAIEVISDAQFDSMFPGAGAAFNRANDTIVLPESALDNTETLALLIVHEGLHYVQERVGVAGLDEIPGVIGDTIRGAGAVANPQTLEEDDDHAEAQAYLVEAIVANEVGINDPGFGTDPRSGQTRSYGAILDAVRSSSFYA